MLYTSVIKPFLSFSEGSLPACASSKIMMLIVSQSSLQCALGQAGVCAQVLSHEQLWQGEFV